MNPSKYIFMIILLQQFNCNKILRHINRQEESEYEFYVFATAWAGSTCVFHKCSHYGKNNVFNIHGLWPSSKSSWPHECKEVQFTENNFDSFVKQNIYSYWNSQYNPNWSFLNHEIQKHGSCWRMDYGDHNIMDQKLVDWINQYDPNDQFSFINIYLSLVIQLSMDLNIYGVLERDNIVPSTDQQYSIDQIVNALYNEFGPNTVVPICLRDRASGNLYISELRFCLDLNYKPQECDQKEVNRRIRDCRRQNIVYPVFPNQYQYQYD